MPVEAHPTTSPPLLSAEAEVVAYLAGRSHPCPRCAYDLRDIKAAKCPECGETLVLKIGSPKARFGWLILAMVPGCFSGVAALFVLVPIIMTIREGVSPGQNLPWPVVGADAFGFLSAASVWFMYRHRHRLMAWTARRQGLFAGVIWGVHVFMFGVFLLAMWYWK